MYPWKRNSPAIGFTLIELLVVLVIIGIAAANIFKGDVHRFVSFN